MHINNEECLTAGAVQYIVISINASYSACDFRIFFRLMGLLHNLFFLKSFPRHFCIDRDNEILIA